MAVSCRMSAPRRFMLIMVVAACLASGFARVDVIQAVENPHMQDREASEGGKCSADGSTSCVQSCPQQGALDAAMILTVCALSPFLQAVPTRDPETLPS